MVCAEEPGSRGRGWRRDTLVSAHECTKGSGRETGVTSAPGVVREAS